MEHSSSNTRTHPRCPSCMDRCSAGGEEKGGEKKGGEKKGKHQNSHISHLNLDDQTIHRKCLVYQGSLPHSASGSVRGSVSIQALFTLTLTHHPSIHSITLPTHSPTHASHPPIPTIVSPLVHKVRVCPILQQHTEDGGKVSLCCHVQDPTLVVVHITHTCLGQQLGGEMVASNASFSFMCMSMLKYTCTYGRLASFLGSLVRRR